MADAGPGVLCSVAESGRPRATQRQESYLGDTDISRAKESEGGIDLEHYIKEAFTGAVRDYKLK